MSDEFQLQLISKALVDLGYAPVAALLDRKRAAPSQSPMQKQLLAHILACLNSLQFDSLLLLFGQESTVYVEILDPRRKAIGRYLLLRFLFLKMILDVKQGSDSSTKEEVNLFFLLKVVPALDDIEDLHSIPILALLAQEKNHSLSLLLRDAAYQDKDTSNVFTSELLLVPVTQKTFQDILSLDQCLAHVLSYLLPVTMNLVDTKQNTSNGTTDANFSDILNDALLYRISRSPYYLPPLQKGRFEQRLLEDFAELQQKTELDFPIHNLYTLADHKDEVWYAKFSPSGRFLATGSLDDTCIIYDVIDKFRKVAVLSPTIESDESSFLVLSFKPPLDKKKGVICVSWEPYERYVVVCCLDTIIRVWNIENLTLPKRMTRSMEDSPPKLVACFSLGEGTRTWPCEFLPTEKEMVPRFVVGSPDKVLKAFSIEGVELLDFYSDTEEWQKALEEESTGSVHNEEDAPTSSYHKNTASQFNRINDLAISPSGKLLVSANNDKQVFFYEIPDLANPSAVTNKIGLLSLSGRLTSCNISANGKYMLLSIAPELLQVWDISPLETGEKPFLKSKLLGLSQALFMIRSCFGYLPRSSQSEELILSGSDDGCVYIWRLQTGQLITRVKGHEGLCNSVDWNRFYVPRKNGVDYGNYWCSVGDDRLVRIWGPESKD